MEQAYTSILTDEELEKELNHLKELNRNIILSLEKLKKGRCTWRDYEKAVQEYEYAKNELYARLQR